MAKVKQIAKEPKVIQPTTETAVQPAVGKESMVGIIVWTLIAVVGLAIVYNINKPFFEGRINQYWEDYKTQKEELEIDERKKNRFGWPYYIADMLTQEMKKKGAKNTEVLLVPPSLLFFGGDKEKQAKYGGVVPEPAVFYYYSGTKVIQKNCKTNCNANWFVNVASNGFSIEKINNKQQQDSVVNTWSAYEADKY